MTAPEDAPDDGREDGSDDAADNGREDAPEHGPEDPPSEDPPSEDVPGNASGAGLSAQERAVLSLERRSWTGPGAKERAIREQLDISPVRYYQLLNALIDDRRALAEDPVTVNRLRRVRDARRGRR